ncbi:hypothetical protein FSP39_010401 [Pinctada imbricata]|uniref:Alpha-and gamma-adaptin-binding protein p34 n=1 Tax=Pinctada imbricata TaxID=66713 RepID=A0AA88Y387_PINIB|nr:hypothetical protein FSP39_010401 [Pinctada imbricata]
MLGPEKTASHTKILRVCAIKRPTAIEYVYCRICILDILRMSWSALDGCQFIPLCDCTYEKQKFFLMTELHAEVLRVEKLPDGEILLEDIKGYDWHIETKYYTADIKLCSTQNRTIGNPQFAESMQAIVLMFDPDEKKSFDLVKAWLPYLAEIEPSIQLLVCKTCTEDNDIDRLTVQHWCIDNDFELVELEPESVDGQDDSDDDFGETTGVQRIIQALHAHTWSNLTMKDKPDILSPYMKKLMEEQSKEIKENSSSTVETNTSNTPDNVTMVTNSSVQSSSGAHITNSQCDDCSKVNGSLNSTDSSAEKASGIQQTKGKTDISKHGQKKSLQEETYKDKGSTTNQEVGLESLLPMDDMDLMQAVCSGDDEEAESFEQLFSKFRLMKEKAESLPPDQRKKYAEHVALSFWKAMGGDEDEIEGLSDDSN